MREQLLREAARFHRRVRWIGALDRFLELAFSLTLAVAALLLLDRLAFEAGIANAHALSPALVIAVFGAALGLAGLGSLPVLLNPPRAAAVLWQADRALGSEDGLLTSVELAAGGAASPFAPALLERTARRLDGLDIRRIFPAAPVGYRAAIALSLLTGGLLVLFPPALVPAPHAGFSVEPRRGAAPFDVSAESLSSGPIDSLDWDFGDGGTATGPSATHRYETPGRYTVSLTARGPGGSDTETRSQWIEVLDGRMPVADFAAEPPKGRAPLTVRFANRSRNASAFRWDLGDGATSTDLEALHTYSTPGTYTVVLTAENEAGRDVAAQRAAVTVVGPDAPLADFRGIPRKGKAPLEVQFDDLSDGPVDSCEWDFGDPISLRDNASAERSPSHTYRWPGRYTVRLRVQGPGGEDSRIREKYIEVDDGEGGGPGSGGGRPPGGSPLAAGGGAAGIPGRLFAEPSKRPTVKLVPEAVPLDGAGDLVEKVRNVMLPGTGESSSERPYTEAFGSYRRAAEDSMERDQVPPALRDYVKRYFDRIRPK